VSAARFLLGFSLATLPPSEGNDGSTFTAVNGKLISQLDFENLTGTDRGRKSAGDSNDRKSEVRNPFCCDVAVCAGAAQPGLSN